MSFGPLSFERHKELCAQGVHLHVFVNGEDVTTRCDFADDTPGRALACLFKRDAHGRFYFDPAVAGPATEIIRDAVEIREGAPFQ